MTDHPEAAAAAQRAASPADEIAASAEVCTCGHVREAHEHYRRGTDCSLCDCPRFRRARA